MRGTLILCATPIGNLGDAPPRLRDALERCDLVYAEDTRRTGALLEALGVAKELRSYFVGNEAERSIELAEHLSAGRTVALVTDAGTPAVADPGLTAVRTAVRVGATVTVVPGPSAVTAAVAVSGLPSERFVFEGFLPRKGKERSQRLEALATEERTLVFFASTSRVARDLADLAEAVGDDRDVVVCRELTKMHEEVWRGTLREAADHWSTVAPRGEFTLVVGGGTGVTPDFQDAVDAVLAEVEGGLPLAEAARRIAATTGTRRRRLYEAALRRREAQLKPDPGSPGD